MQVSRFWARGDETACQADRIPHRVFADSSTNTQPVQTCAILYIVVQYWFQCRPEAEDDCLHPNGAPAARACRADQKRHAQAGGADHVRNASGRRIPSVPRHRAQGAGTAEKGRTHRNPHGIGQLCGVQRRRSGAPTTTELLSIALVGRPLALEGESECERFYEIARRRLFRSTPVSYEVSYLPAIPALREAIERMEGLVDGSISKTMKQAGLQAASGYMDVSADRLGPIAQALEKTPETVFLLSERHNFSDDGTLVEYVRSFLDPSHFTLHVTAGENGGNHGDR